MTTATVTSKGQITIPANVRLALQVQPGDRVEFVEVDPGRFEVVAATVSVTELKGMFGKPASKRFDRGDEQGDRSPRQGGAMTGLDTNVLVRYIMQDEAKQAAKATALIESLTVDAPGFVSLVSVVELGWVLSSSYDLTREQVAQTLDLLLRTKQVVVDRADLVLSTLRVFRAGSADFADCLIERTAANAGCDRTMTFDAAAAKAAGMTLIR